MNSFLRIVTTLGWVWIQFVKSELIITCNKTNIEMSDTVQILVEFKGQSMENVWPFVNDTQWGAFQPLSFDSSRNISNTLLLLPLPNVGINNINVSNYFYFYFYFFVFLIWLSMFKGIFIEITLF